MKLIPVSPILHGYITKLGIPYDIHIFILSISIGQQLQPNQRTELMEYPKAQSHYEVYEVHA